MTPEERHLLELTHKLAEDNNKILISIRRSNRVSTIFRVLYWIIIIGISVGAYYFIQPYANDAFNLFNVAKQDLQQIQGVANKFK